MRGKRREVMASGYADLSVQADGKDTRNLPGCIQRLASYGYSTVAVDQVVGGKKPVIPEPLAVKLKRPSQGNVRVLKRVTLKLTDQKQTYLLSTNSSASLRKYDLVAARPMTEKLLSQCVEKLDVDIISFDITVRMPFFVKTSHVSQALARGIYFELTYSPVIQDESARRNAISNAQNIVRICKGRNVILSSGTDDCRMLRSPRDVMALARLFGLSQDQCVAGVSSCPARAVSHGYMRSSTFRGVTTVALTEHAAKGMRVPSSPFVVRADTGAALVKAVGHRSEKQGGKKGATEKTEGEKEAVVMAEEVVKNEGEDTTGSKGAGVAVVSKSGVEQGEEDEQKEEGKGQARETGSGDGEQQRKKAKTANVANQPKERKKQGAEAGKPAGKGKGGRGMRKKKKRK